MYSIFLAGMLAAISPLPVTPVKQVPIVKLSELKTLTPDFKPSAAMYYILTDGMIILQHFDSYEECVKYADKNSACISGNLLVK